jgi:[ribosomal protein S5]-alanine N-acetyltransferase
LFFCGLPLKFGTSHSLTMNGLRLTTTRLELVAGAVELAKAEIDDLPELARLLDVPLPTHWPPPLNDEQSQKYFLDALLNAAPNHAGWYLWYCLRRGPRALIGSAGFKGIPANGVVEIGYSMLEEHQRNGYCTEAVRGLIGWAFHHADVNLVIAHTLPGLLPSIRVMEKCGLVFAGNGPVEDGMQTVRYELTRKRFEQLRS